MKKKYLFLTITSGFAGAEHVQVDYLKFVDYGKYSVTLGVETDVFSPELKKNNLPVEVIDLPRITGQDRFVSKFKKYYKFFKNAKPDCVVFNQYWLKSFTLAEILAAFLVTKGNAYMIVHDCPPVTPQYRGQKLLGLLDLGLSWRMCRLFQTLLGYFTKSTIAVSKAAENVLVAGHKFPKWNVKMVYHGVDVQTYVPSREGRNELRQKLGIASSDTVIISTAMLWPVKRIDRLVEAFAAVATERPDIHLLVAGTGSEHTPLINMVQSLDKPIGNRIHFLGYRDDILHLLQLSDVYVLPSDSEGLPIACLEAMSCGLVGIVTNCGGTVEIMKDGYNGLLVEKSYEGIRQGLQKVLSLNVAKREELSRNARRSVEEEFDLKKNIRSGLGVLQLNHG